MTTSKTALLVLAALVLGACGGSRSPLDNPRLLARYERNLPAAAARDSGCAPGAITATRVAREVWVAQTCNLPIEYRIECAGRSCNWIRLPTLNEQAAPLLQCQPQLIQQQPAGVPTVRVASGCGRQATFSLTCNGPACGWSATSAVVTLAPQTVDPVAPLGSEPAPPRVTTSGGEGGDPSASLQSQVELQRDALMSCIEGAEGTITLTLRWTGDGRVNIVLPPQMAGTVAEGCIQAILGALSVSAQSPGEVVVPLN